MPSQKSFKQDINFLENPLWLPNPRATNYGANIVDKDGYEYECSGSPPSKVDIIFLYFLLSVSQENGWAQSISLAPNAILTACGVKGGKVARARLIQSLDKWMSVHIKFKGTFYNGVDYEQIKFQIINEIHELAGTKTLTIEFNARWLEKIQSSTFFKYLSFEQLRQFRSPIALRLYEILVKSFLARKKFEIGVHTLADKIPMAEVHYAHIVPKIKSAVKAINNSSKDLQLFCESVKQGRNKGKFVFTKLTDSRIDDTSDVEAVQIPDHIVELIPLNQRLACIDLCRKILKKHGDKGLEFFIKMTNDSNPDKNYGGMLFYFFNSTPDLYETYLAMEKDAETKQYEKRIEKEKVLAEARAKAQKELRKQEVVRNEISAMDDQTLDAFDTFILDQTLTPFEKIRFKKGAKDSLRYKFFPSFQRSLLTRAFGKN